MSIQCGIFIINALRFQKLFWRIFKFLCWSIAEIFHFPSQDGHNAVPLGLNCHQRLINPEWSSPHQDGFVESSCQSRSQRRKVRRWDLRPSRGRTYLQNRIIWWFDVWYHLKEQMPKELESLHLTSNYEDEDDYQKETMMIIRRERWLLWEKNGDDHEKRRIMRRGRWWL